MEWIKIESSTQLPKDKTILVCLKDNSGYEVLSYDSEDEDIQIWKTDCGDTFSGTLQWFDEHILSLYSHYIILNQPD